MDLDIYYPHGELSSTLIKHPTRQDVEKFGAELGVRFPQTYVEIATRYAYGGIPHPRRLFLFYDDWEQEPNADVIEIFLHFDDRFDDNVFDNYEHALSWTGEPLVVPFTARATGGYCLAFDFRKSKTNPSIVYYSQGNDMVGVPTGLYHVADSLEELFGGLKTREEARALGVDL